MDVDLSPSSCPWPANSIVRKPDGSISVEWNEANLTDETLEKFIGSRLEALLKHLPSCVPDQLPVQCSLDLSSNRLRRPDPIAQLLRQLREAPVHTTDLRLHKNQFTDVVAAVLAEHIQEAANAGRPLMQLHLSGNAFTSAGIRTLIEVAHRCGAYPRQGSCQRKALWLRAEHQKPPILDAEELLQKCKAAGHPVCLVPKNERPPPDAVVQMHFGFTMPHSDFSKGDCKAKGKGKSSGDAGQNGKGKGDHKGQAVPEGAKGRGKEMGSSRTREQIGERKAVDTWKGGDIWTGWKSADAWSPNDTWTASEAWDEGEAWSGIVDWAGADTWSTGDVWKAAGGGIWRVADASAWRAPGRGAGAGPGRGAGAAKGLGKSQEAKAGAKGKSASAPDRSGLFKTQLCWFFDRGVCEKGEQCPFAHGAEELRPFTPHQSAPARQPPAEAPSQAASAGAESRNSEADAMVWLKENRSKGGEEGARFERVWKEWCREHGLFELVKSKRIDSMFAFKKAWEEALLTEPPSDPVAEPPTDGSELGVETEATAAEPIAEPVVASTEELALASTEEPAVAGTDAPVEASTDADKSALSALAPDPENIGMAMPSFAKMPKLAAPPHEPQETTEEALLRTLGDKLLGRPAASNQDAGTEPHKGPSWETGPPLPSP